MNENIVMLFVFFMLAVCLFFIFILLTWNRRSLRHQKRLHELKTRQQKELLRATIEGQEKERKKFAENLHDDIGPLLSAMKMQVSSIKKDQQNAEILQDFQKTLNRTVRNIRNVSRQMSPAVFEELGLGEAIEYMIHNFQQYGEIKITHNWDPSVADKVTEQEAMNIYRIVQESLTNIIRHSGATRALIESKVTDESINIIIEDDGQGFQTTRDLETIGLGLQNMKARSEVLGGQLTIDSSGTGTTINLTIQLDANGSN